KTSGRLSRGRVPGQGTFVADIRQSQHPFPEHAHSPVGFPFRKVPASSPRPCDRAERVSVYSTELGPVRPPRETFVGLARPKQSALLHGAVRSPSTTPRPREAGARERDMDSKFCSAVASAVAIFLTACVAVPTDLSTRDD